MALLEGLRRAPVRAAETLLLPALGLYPLLRPRHARRLRSCFAASPFPALSLKSYYTARLRLLLRGLELHGRATDAVLKPRPSSRRYPPVRMEGAEHYEKALAGNRPVALIGLHTGVLELLHRIPEVPPGRPFLILTAPAFSPPLTGFMARGRERDGKRVLQVGGGSDWGSGKGASRKGSAGGNEGRAQAGLESGLREVIALRGVLALMVDQHPGPGEECEFLTLWDRIKVPYPARLLRFLARRDFQLLPVSTRLDPDGVSRFRFHPVLTDPSPGVIRSFLEESIAAAPEQWNWSYPKIMV